MSKTNLSTANNRDHNFQTLQQRRLTPSAYFRQHVQAFVEGFHKLSQTPGASLMTILVLSIALLLPTTMLVGLSNVKRLTGNWQQSTAISVYLHPEINEAQAAQLMQALQTRTDVKKVTYISPAEGLKTFEQQTGFNQVLSALNSNPLPGVLEIIPTKHDQLSLSQLQSALQEMPQVEIAQLDMQWVNRLYGIIDLVSRIAYSIMVLLAVGVLLIIGNTIRLAIQKYHLEIAVIKLAGGSDAYIRRPFLYAGILYGFTAGVIAWLLLDSFVRWLQSPVASLADLYGSHFQLHSISSYNTLLLLLCSILLGYIGSWLAINSHLASVETEY